MKSQHELNSYGQILKSSSIMGGVAVVVLILGMIRNKFAAVIIGTTGVGLGASFTAIQGLIGTIAGFGIQSSAVREVAAAYAKGDDRVVGETVLTLRRICWFTGTAGALSMFLLSPVLSHLTFASIEYQWDIAALGLIILFVNLSGGQSALLQGARRIADMARAQIVGAVAGTAITISLYWWLGIRGIIPALILMAVMQLVISWHFAKRLPVPEVKMTWLQSFNKAGGMVKLGFVMMTTGLMSAVVTYTATALIAKMIDVQAVGIYSAAFTLSGMFVNFVLNAMGSDYYPRLTAAVADHAILKKLVNEQTEIGLLLALPGLLATMVLAPWIIQIFYTKDFLPAVALITWFILGSMGRVVTWPMGFVMLALGKHNWFFVTEAISNITHIGLIMLCLKLFGLVGVAIAFFLIYLIYFFIVLFASKALINYSVSASVYLILLIASAGFSIGAVVNTAFDGWSAMIISVVIVIASVFVSFRGISRRLDGDFRFAINLGRVPILGQFIRAYIK